MPVRSILAVAAFAASIGLAQPAAAQTAHYCNNRVTGSDVTFVSRAGGGYGVMFIDYSIRLKNETSNNVSAQVSVGTGLGPQFTGAHSSQQIARNATVTVRVGTFAGSAGSRPPTNTDVLAQVRVSC